MKNILASLLFLCMASGLSAIDLDLQVAVGGGIGSAAGVCFEDKGSAWADLCAASVTSPGTWSMDTGLALGGIGGGLVVSNGEGFPFKAPFSLYLGADIGLWGGALTVLSPSGATFAWSETRDLVLSLRAWLRATMRREGFRLFGELGPEFGTSIAYRVDESVNGLGMDSLIWAASKDFGFLGLGLGLGFDYPMGGMRWGLEAVAECGLVRIASASGALGAVIGPPWRIQLCVTGSFGLGAGSATTKD